MWQLLFWKQRCQQKNASTNMSHDRAASLQWQATTTPARAKAIKSCCGTCTAHESELLRHESANSSRGWQKQQRHQQ